MKIPILIEVTEDHRFRATGGEPFTAAVEADTPEAALDKMRRGVLERMAQGGRIAALDLPSGSNPWLQVFGMFQDDPLFDEWQQAINDNRRIVNDSPSLPCAVERRCVPAGANPARQLSLQPEAVGAVQGGNELH